MLLLENEAALTVKTNVFDFAMAMGYSVIGLRTNVAKTEEAQQCDDTDFGGFLWRVVSRQLLKWLASVFQFGSIILPVQLLLFLHFHPCTSFTTLHSLSPSIFYHFYTLTV